MNKLITLLALLIGSFSLSDSYKAQPTEVPSENKFDMEDFRWLVGSWTGDGFGGISHETWAEPVNGVMMGMYRHINAEGELNFYEFLLLDENGLRLKHFNPDLTGWEEKDDMLTFEMISYSKDKIELKGLTFEKKSDTEMTISLKMRRSDGFHTEVFNMKRDL
ncbi:DUF6265 family protein [Gracilimonas sp.]|uniref:DUF6265 family protein n=1 Tax=Gracilimonas sp. TaxID=1974203 RepID=UPI003BABB996